MPAPALAIWLPRVLAPYASRLFATASRSSAPLRMGRFTPRYGTASRGYSYSLARGYSRPRHNWNRIKIPLYGSPLVRTPVQRVIVPPGTYFTWENPNELPGELPQISFRPTRARARYLEAGLPVPAYEMVTRAPPARAYGRTPIRPERNRRRKDAKLDFGYNRLLSFINRTYGEYDEYADFVSAWQNNRSPLGVATVLAMNEAIDYSFGLRARTLRKHIYSNPDIWRLPVGFDTLSRLWR